MAPERRNTSLMPLRAGASLVGLVFACGCVVKTEPVPGPKGESGKDGADNTAALTALQAKVDELQSKVDTLQQRSIEPDCPLGYTRSPEPPATFLPDAILCTRGVDEVVKVGVGSAAFWMDRYEATLWDDEAGGGMQRFSGGADDSTAAFPKNGQITVPLYALSVPGKAPAGSITWFQAMEACAASGKRLPSIQEWMRAARGTVDPGVNDGSENSKCHTDSSVGKPRLTGQALGDAKVTSCVSDWGVEDAIGNMSERAAEWHAGLYESDAYGTLHYWQDWPDASFNGDAIANVSSWAKVGNQGEWQQGLPAALILGGDFSNGSKAGIFLFGLNASPALWESFAGVRCVVPR